MIDPFVAGHRHKAAAEAKAAADAAKTAKDAAIKAKFDALAKPKPATASQPYVPQKPAWDQ